ncbi:transposase family protein [Paenibacillus larvae]
MLCNCKDWETIELWTQERTEWLRQYIELKNGVP